MFKIKSSSVLDSTGLKDKFRKTIVTAIASTLCLSGMSQAHATDMSQKIDKNTNIFSSQIKNDIQQKEADNTVFLVWHNKTDRDKMIIIGSGVVIANSGDSINHNNKILTAFHVASLSGMIGDGDAINQSRWNDSLDVYNSKGVRVATAQLSATNNDRILTGEINQDVAKDIATLKVTPLSNDYSKMKGLELASNPSQSIFPIQSAQEMGFAAGGSGGPVFSQDGKILGIVSFMVVPHITANNIDIPLTNMHTVGEYKQKNHWLSIHDLNPQAVSGFQDNSFMNMLSSENNYVWAVPVSASPNIIKDLGKAIPEDFNPQTNISKQQVTYAGYPSSVGVLSSTYIVDPNAKSYSGPLSHDKEYVQEDVDHNMDETVGQAGQRMYASFTASYVDVHLEKLEKQNTKKTPKLGMEFK